MTMPFAALPPSSKAVHFASLLAVAAAIILLIAPAAYHRIAPKGKAEDRVLRYSSQIILLALGFLALGMAGNAYVTIHKIPSCPFSPLGLPSQCYWPSPSCFTRCRSICGRNATVPTNIHWQRSKPWLTIAISEVRPTEPH